MKAKSKCFSSSVFPSPLRKSLCMLSSPPPPLRSLLSAPSPLGGGRKQGHSQAKGPRQRMAWGFCSHPLQKWGEFLIFPPDLLSSPWCSQPALAKEQGSAQARARLVLAQENRPLTERENILSGLPAPHSHSTRAQRRGDPLQPPGDPVE